MSKKPVFIIPAVLPKSFEDLSEHLALIHGAAKEAQVDIVDGAYAHGRTWPYKDRATFDRIVADERGLPFWDEMDFEFDLMINDPEKESLNFVRAGATRIVLHAQSPGVLEALNALVELREDGGAFTVEVGVALPADGQPDMLEPFEAQFDFVQVMGIMRVGRQGEPFERRSLYLVERLRRRYEQLTIQVDGAVTRENAKDLAHAGADRLIVGHDIWNTSDPKAELEFLKQEANS